MNRETKDQQIELWRKSFSEARAGLVVELTGVNGPKHEELRLAMRSAGATLRVAKNTLARRALEGTALEALTETLLGPSAVVLLPDEWHGALRATLGYLERDYLRYVPLFARPAIEEGAPAPRKHQPNRPRARPRFALKAGWLDGRPLSAEEVWALAALPELVVSRRRLLGLLQGPASVLVWLLDPPRTR